MDTRSWIERVDTTVGRDVLLDADLRIIALSKSISERGELQRHQIIGRRPSELPGMRTLGAALERFPLFESDVRGIKARIQVQTPSLELLQELDLWAVVTADCQRLLHVTIFDVEPPQPRCGEWGSRLLDIRLVLLDGRVVSYPVNGTFFGEASDV